MKLLYRMLKVLFAFILFLVIITYLFMQQKPFGKLPSGVRLEKIRSSPYYKKDRFENLIHTPMLSYLPQLFPKINGGQILNNAVDLILRLRQSGFGKF